MFLYVHTTWWTRRMIHSWSPNILFFYPFVDYDAFSSIARDPKSETVPHRVRQQRQHRERSSLRHGLAGPQSVSCAPSLGCSAEDKLYAQSKALRMKCLSNFAKTNRNPRVPCRSSVLPRINLEHWRDAGEQSPTYNHNVRPSG